MAAVYKAAHESGQVVAIKVLAATRTKDPVLLARFQREARLVLQLRHPNVVRAFQVGTAGGVVYIVMEYLEGETLDEVLTRRGKLPPAEAVRVVYQALLGLEELHQKGVVHRDLKPANLMLVAPGGRAATADSTLSATVKILDIGLARELAGPAAADGAVPITGEGVLLGTPEYLAPEQARDARSADIRADVYSLGCVLYRCLTGQTPFPDTNVINQLLRHAKEAPRPLAELSPDVPEGLQQILNWMMAKDPAQRYPTPERAAQALKLVLTALGEPGGAAEPGKPQASYLSWVEQNETVEFDALSAQAVFDVAQAATAARTDIPVGKLVPDDPRPRRGGRTPARPPQRKDGPATPVPELPAVPEPARPPLPPPPAARAPLPPPPAPTSPPAESFDVELVPVTAPGRAARPAERAGLFDWDRRDFLMLGLGGLGVLVAILFGWLFAQLLRRKPAEGPPANTTDETPTGGKPSG
jgi:serine/threonine protein kinase